MCHGKLCKFGLYTVVWRIKLRRLCLVALMFVRYCLARNLGQIIVIRISTIGNYAHKWTSKFCNSYVSGNKTLKHFIRPTSNFNKIQINFILYFENHRVGDLRRNLWNCGSHTRSSPNCATVTELDTSTLYDLTYVRISESFSSSPIC
jgi:hypothetical protein